MNHPGANMDGPREKQQAAVSSVWAALFLVASKIVIGVLTGSLGIIAEAAHSGLDLLAALVTALSVRFSDKPADRGHAYGHGKVENLSALIETVLLVGTCFWIIWAAVSRIAGRRVEIEVGFWAFFVMILSILVDVSRSNMLYRAARKFKSQALEADALHFSTDIWSSLVVILGLACVKLHDFFPSLDFLLYADAAAAMAVSVIVLGVSFKLASRAVSELLDQVPPNLEETILTAAKSVSGVRDLHRLRVRSSGPVYFVDLHVHLDGDLTLTQAHDLTRVVKAAIRLVVPRCDVTIHAEPYEKK